MARLAREIWEAALGELQIHLSKPNYRSFFDKTRGLSYQANQFVVGVPNTFAAEYLDKKQRSLIEKVLIPLTAPGIQVVFQVISQNQSPPDGDAAATPVPARMSPPGLNPRYVFETFVEGGSNHMARASALSVVQNPGKSFNPLFICGATGLGKTHLLHAIGHLASANHQVICVSAEQFTNDFITALRERNTEEFRNKYRNTDVLLVDDIQFLCGKEQTEEGFFHTFNELHNANRQIVMTSDRLPKAIALAERLRSRFEWGLVVKVKPPEMETRLAILQDKARQMQAGLPPDVLAFIARQVQSNVRELEGALNRVMAYTRLLGVPPTIEIASRAFEPITAREPEAGGTRTPRLLVEAVAESFRLTPADLEGQKRDRETTLARRIAMYLIRQETHCSLAQIGQELGGRDAAAVSNACRSITGSLESSPYLKRKIQDIQQALNRQPKS
ncbi:MAG: chromosomal replication initiator protein DnaA [Chloroflexi bacterium]|nr:chromosomal replication initiator protein DnaA [Chloroflexota bacterium]